MIEDFSAAYYHVKMDVQPYEDGPVISRELYDYINNELHSSKDVPVFMGVGINGPLLKVKPENGIPGNVIALPREMISDMGENSVFILKEDYVTVIGQYYG